MSGERNRTGRTKKDRAVKPLEELVWENFNSCHLLYWSLKLQLRVVHSHRKRLVTCHFCRLPA